MYTSITYYAIFLIAVAVKSWYNECQYEEDSVQQKYCSSPTKVPHSIIEKYFTTMNIGVKKLQCNAVKPHPHAKMFFILTIFFKVLLRMC
jgi:nitrate reductase cytochrome c-type subunit